MAAPGLIAVLAVRPRHRLTVLVVQARPLIAPAVLPRLATRALRGRLHEDAVVLAGHALQASQEADMMHDALRGDATGAMIAGQNKDLKALDEADKDFAEHAALIGEKIDRNRKVDLGPDVAARLVRWALVKDYGLDFPYRSPEFKSLEITGAKALVTLDCFDSSLYAFDTPAPVGFAI